MRTMIRSTEFDEFYNSLPANAKKKLDYVLNVVAEIKVVNEQFVKQIVNTQFYELRVQVGNEYRVVVFTIDHENFIEAEQILLLNGFMKKSNKDYKQATDKAIKILERYADENED